MKFIIIMFIYYNPNTWPGPPGLIVGQHDTIEVCNIAGHELMLQNKAISKVTCTQSPANTVAIERGRSVDGRLLTDVRKDLRLAK